MTTDGPRTANPVLHKPFIVSGAAPAGSFVTLHFHRIHTAANDYSIIRTVTADEFGRWSRTISGDVDYRYYATAVVDGVTWTSPHTLLQVAVGLDGTTVRNVKAGAPTTLRGTGEAGVIAYVHLRTAGTSVTVVRAVRVRADGTWSYAFTPVRTTTLFVSRDGHDSRGSRQLYTVRPVS